MNNYDNNELVEDQVNKEEGFSNAFSEEESGLNSALQIKSNITIKLETLKIDDLITSNFKKISRSDSLIGLTGVVEEWGVVNPIHVMKLEEDGFFMILDGLRRVFGALRSGKKEIPAMVWDFEDVDEGKEKANLISLMINRSQRYRAVEMWELMKILEEVNGATPGLIEYLLQMQPGEAMKLKDVMLADDDYYEIKNDLIDGIIDINQAYRKLMNERRKENRLLKEDSMSLEGGGSVDGDADVGNISDEQRLSEDDVRSLLDLTSVDVEEETLESLDRSNEAGGEYHQQKVGEREPLDPELRKEVLERDEYKCQCCGVGGIHNLAILAVHHIIPVYLGGYDKATNLVTLCVNHHLLVHNYANGKLKVDLDKLTEDEKRIFRNIFKYGNIIIEATKRAGLTNKEVRKMSAGSTRHPFPDELLKQNSKAIESK